MRSLRLTPVLAAALAVSALAPAGAAAAHRRQAAASRCHLSIFAEPRFVTSGESAQVFGLLRCTPGTATDGQTVTVYEHAAGSGGQQVLGTTTTATGGFYSILAPSVTADTSFRAVVANGHSGVRFVRVAPQVTVKGPSEHASLLTGARNAVTFSGTVAPSDAGAVVLLQRESATSSEDWFTIQRGVVGAGGAYSFTHRFVIPGAANLRVLVRPHGPFAVRGISNTLSYAISQRQNPRLTIASSADPAASGQTITISGTLASGAGRPVSLLARTFNGGTVVAAKATTGAGGSYSFAQTPLQSTYYRVAGPHASSTILFEGVSYVLTAGVSATTVQSGQKLTFAGTVAPARVEHAVYLERSNLRGGGYHVVDVGTVAADGTYTIAHAIFGAGKETFRVKIPGDRLNQSASSAPFTIEVTPAPGAALHPQAPARLPSEGH